MKERIAANREELGLNQSDAERLAQLDRFATLMDSSMTIPGTNLKIGWDAIIGLIPGFGDLAGLGASGWILSEGRKLGINSVTTSRMSLNIAIETVVGAIPLIGDLFDAAFRANNKNVALIRKDLARRARRSDAPHTNTNTKGA